MVTIAVRERHYPRDRLVLRVSQLRVLPRLRLLSVRCLHVFTVHVPSLHQTFLLFLTSPNESLRATRRFQYSVPTSYHVILHLHNFYRAFKFNRSPSPLTFISIYVHNSLVLTNCSTLEELRLYCRVVLLYELVSSKSYVRYKHSKFLYLYLLCSLPSMSIRLPSAVRRRRQSAAPSTRRCRLSSSV